MPPFAAMPPRGILCNFRAFFNAKGFSGIRQNGFLVQWEASSRRRVNSRLSNHALSGATPGVYKPSLLPCLGYALNYVYAMPWHRDALPSAPYIKRRRCLHRPPPVYCFQS